LLLEEKRALRSAMMARRQQVPLDDRARLSAAAAARLAALPELVAASAAGKIVAGYLAIVAKGEIDPAPALAAARARGARVALPRVSATPSRLSFHTANDDDPTSASTSTSAALTPGRFGLLEPHASAPEVAIETIEVMILPGLAFDSKGRRLGYGGGYYDDAAGRLRAAGSGFLVGLAYDFQMVERCPAGATDVDVDCIVTEVQVVRCQGDHE
jgi:5-formyltetrahydrofolate cyclo-ligase